MQTYGYSRKMSNPKPNKFEAQQKLWLYPTPCKLCKISCKNSIVQLLYILKNTRHFAKVCCSNHSKQQIWAIQVPDVIFWVWTESASHVLQKKIMHIVKVSAAASDYWTHGGYWFCIVSQKMCQSLNQKYTWYTIKKKQVPACSSLQVKVDFGVCFVPVTFFIVPNGSPIPDRDLMTPLNLKVVGRHNGGNG